MLRKNKHAHPLMYMRGLKFDNLVAIVDFLYFGEADTYQENMNAFLTIAEELDLKGLNGKEGDREKKEEEYPSTHTDKPTEMSAAVFRMNKNQHQQQKQLIPHDSHVKENYHSKAVVALPKEKFDGDLKDLDEKVKSMIGRGVNMIKLTEKQMIKAYVCQVCGKEGQSILFRDHIEANHLEGISIPCHSCDQTFRSRQSKRHHNSNHHKNTIC